jgi:hypothetical protein
VGGEQPIRKQGNAKPQEQCTDGQAGTTWW